MSDGKIFISYRRADTSGYAGRLFDRLSARFGEEHIFMDVEGLDPGVDFVEALEKAVGACDVLIVLIGTQWLTVTDEKGHRRLDNPEDFVRLEIVAALDRGVRVIPILVQGARMPGSRELPAALKRLARLNAFNIRHERFNADADRLTRAIVKYFKEDAERREQETAEQAAREQAKRKRQEREAAEKAALEQAEREQHARKIVQWESQIADCLAAAQTAMEQEDWKTAQAKYREILLMRSDHAEAQSGLQIASQNLELAHLYGQAILYQDEGQFERALNNLRRIQEKDTAYRNVPDLITAIEALLAEQARQISVTEAPIAEPKREVPIPTKTAKTHQSRKQSAASSSHTLLRWVVLGGGCLGLIIITLGLAFWGGNALLSYLNDGAQNPRSSIPPTKTSIPPTITTWPTNPPLPKLTPVPPDYVDDYGVPMALIPAGPFEMGGMPMMPWRNARNSVAVVNAVGLKTKSRFTPSHWMISI